MYATAQQFIDHFGPREALALTDRDKSGAIDHAALERLLALASEEVNGYIGRRYALPLTTPGGQPADAPQPLRLAVLNIARYHGTGTEVRNQEEITVRYKSTIKWLEGVAAGTILLGNGLAAASAGGAAPTGGPTAVRTGQRLFADGVLGQVL